MDNTLTLSQMSTEAQKKYLSKEIILKGYKIKYRLPIIKGYKFDKIIKEALVGGRCHIDIYVMFNL